MTWRFYPFTLGGSDVGRQIFASGPALEGRNRVLLVGVARNTGASPLEIDERSCADTDSHLR